MGNVEANPSPPQDQPVHHVEDTMLDQQLKLLFSKYDVQEIGRVKMSQFVDLIGDTFNCRDGTVPSNVKSIASTIASDILSYFQQAEQDSFNIDTLVLSVKKTNSPFDHRCTGRHGLSKTLKEEGQTILAIRDVVSATEKEAPFMPTFEWQTIHPWQEPLPWTGLEIQMESRRARIPEVIQAVLMIPLLDRMVRVWANRRDSVEVLCGKISTAWPGLHGRQRAPPASDTISLLHEGKPLARSRTVEDIRLYFIAKDISVIVAPSEASAPEAKANAVDESLAKGGGSRTRTHAPVPVTAPSQSPGPSKKKVSFWSRAKASGAGFHDDRSAAAFDRISGNLSRVDLELKAEARRLLGDLKRSRQCLERLQDKLVVEMDAMPEKDAIDEVDRVGLKEMAKELRMKIGEMEVAMASLEGVAQRSVP